MSQNSRAELDRLLKDRNEHPERMREIDAEIREKFVQTCAILVLDMCGFSRLTMRYGITHFLAMIRRCHDLALPLFADHGGSLVKTDADNIFESFPEVSQALHASLDLLRVLDSVNAVLPADWDLHVTMGIGYGEILMVAGHDMFGNEMNLASKLGEDIGEDGDIMLTEAAYGRIESHGWPFQKTSVSVSGMAFPAYKYGAKGKDEGTKRMPAPGRPA
jgi:class 3 adenylate cyclase